MRISPSDGISIKNGHAPFLEDDYEAPVVAPAYVKDLPACVEAVQKEAYFNARKEFLEFSRQPVEGFQFAVLLVVGAVLVFNGLAAHGHGKTVLRYEFGVQHPVAPRHGSSRVLGFQALVAMLLFEREEPRAVNRHKELAVKPETVKPFVGDKPPEHLDLDHFQLRRLNHLQQIVQGVCMSNKFFARTGKGEEVGTEWGRLPLGEKLAPRAEPEQEHQDSKPEQVARTVRALLRRPGVVNFVHPFVQGGAEKMLARDFYLVGVSYRLRPFLLAAARFRFFALSVATNFFSILSLQSDISFRSFFAFLNSLAHFLASSSMPEGTYTDFVFPLTFRVRTFDTCFSPRAHLHPGLPHLTPIDATVPWSTGPSIPSSFSLAPRLVSSTPIDSSDICHLISCFFKGFYVIRTTTYNICK